ncbi:ATP-dependent nuclease [Thalassobaculum litoreum]|uniref:Putative ATP-dependent endonuclease of the OLD family n=1 Tax=Thalassobaculum litoreum DSM 18839 TaxID=1123362 RepID=A0A8G2BGD4_9PROT|nr:AAA family ATPase [Thalassobaculum litoreum]SDF49982.1 putative ATP-dependent endonuclease of the OLD family [Thalassobaculum litoreum DSM 18839]
MQIKRVKISNFRSIRHAEIELNKTTVLIGPNNAGKTAILEAIRIALTRRWGQRGTGFTEYDVHLSGTRTDPRVGDPVVIEIEMHEGAAAEWPEEVTETLADIIQLDPMSGQSSIIMRVSCAWDEGEESYVPKWEFLNLDRNPLTGSGARSTNFQEFFSFLPVFYLDAIRDAGDEFSARSQFWGRLLRTVQIPDALEQKSVRIFNLLNAKLLAADPLLGNLATSLSDISQVATTGSPGQANLRVLPLNTWDLLSKAEVIYQTDGAKPWLPLVRHGQGVQSLSVMFLFRSFVDLLLGELYRPDSTAVLALEEPETHLHPQAARSLFRHVQELEGQKIVSTHSPYFLQHIPFRDLRVVRASADGTEIRSLPREYRCRVPHLPSIDPIIAKAPRLLEYDRGSSELVIKGEMPDPCFRDLLLAYHGQPETDDFHARLRASKNASLEFIPDTELAKLETFARRIRGEIFFANKWILVEGQSEYHILHGMAKSIGYDLDENGIAVIDFQNNGNPECFAALGRALGYSWTMLVDGDPQGTKFLSSVASRNFDSTCMAERTRQLSAGALENQLVADGLQPELKAILVGQSVSGAGTMNDTDLIAALKDDKCSYAAELGAQCAADNALTKRMPSQLRDVITVLKALP